MNSKQVAAVLFHAARFDSRVRRAMNNPEQSAEALEDWTEALKHVPAVRPEVHWDVAHAVRGYYERRGGDRSAQFRAIEPGDILAAYVPYRRELMNRHTDPIPKADPDDVPAYLAELRATRHAVATGQLAPVQHRAALTAAPTPPTDVVAELRRMLAAGGTPLGRETAPASDAEFLQNNSAASDARKG
jgi:hypothetical protein